MRREGGGRRASANAPGRGNRAGDVSSGAWPRVTTHGGRGEAYVTATQRWPGAESEKVRPVLPDPRHQGWGAVGRVTLTHWARAAGHTA